jgi:hypothetical protein
MLSWWPLLASVLHIMEEFVFPGGFPAWDRTYRPEIRTSITPRFHLVVNGLLILICTAIGLMGASPRGVAAWLTLASLLASNAIFHLVGTIQTKSYSPGIVTGVALYIPMACYGYLHFLRAHQASAGTAITALVIGGSYHFWSSRIHSRRARTEDPSLKGFGEQNKMKN